MPVRSIIFKEQRLVFTVEEGRVTFDEMMANLNRLTNDPDFHPDFNQLSDASLATDTDLSSGNIRLLYQRLVFSPTSRRAVVAPNPFTYGMARMIQAYVELSKAVVRVEIFQDRASAFAWLGVSEDFLKSRLDSGA